MPATFSCTISKIITIPNEVNADIVSNYQEYMRYNGASEHHENNALKTVIAYAKFLGENTTFYDVSAKEQITAYLDTKIIGFVSSYRPIRKDSLVIIAVISALVIAGSSISNRGYFDITKAVYGQPHVSEDRQVHF